MNPYELTAIITAFAIAIAKATPDNDELALISLAYNQLSDTLDTIIAQRVVVEKTEANLNPALTLQG
jgi:hypothetical protein